MKKLIIAILFPILLMAPAITMSWGQTGHRVVGLIAEQYLTKKAAKNIKMVLGHESLAEVANYMDFIKSDPAYKHMDPWHYCTIPDGQSYSEAGTPKEGDVIVTIERLINELKTKQFTDKDEAFALKCLVHLIGDIHQPLHVGRGDDKGGNDIKVDYFGRPTNLHAVWDSGIIDSQKYSYTEYTRWINNPTKAQIAAWQADGVLVWANESMSYRPTIYQLPDNMKLSYRYDFDHIQTVNLRLLQGGVRLAGVLNEIYGK